MSLFTRWNSPSSVSSGSAAGAQTADAARLLARSDLLHLDADVEPLGEDLDELAEVDALVGYVVEDGLDFVALVLHVADFHVQTHVGGDLPRGNHRLVFEGDGLLPAFDVVGLSLAVDFLVLAVVGGESRAAHLAGHQVARQRDDADVVARRGLDGDDVAPLEVEVVDVLVERAARILEAHLHDVARQVDGIILEVSWSLKHPSQGSASHSEPQSQKLQPRPISGLQQFLWWFTVWSMV